MPKDNVKITIDITGRERNVAEILSMLRYVQLMGGWGHSTDFKFSVDGDGAGQIKINVHGWTERDDDAFVEKLRDRMGGEGRDRDIKSFGID